MDSGNNRRVGRLRILVSAVAVMAIAIIDTDVLELMLSIFSTQASVTTGPKAASTNAWPLRSPPTGSSLQFATTFRFAPALLDLALLGHRPGAKVSAAEIPALLPIMAIIGSKFRIFCRIGFCHA